jgi:hypothetical protein
MAKKKRKKPIKRAVSRQLNPFNNKMFVDKLETEVSKILQRFLTPLEQRISVLYETIQNVKANIVAATTLLERKEILTRDEFFEEFKTYMESECVIPDGDGSIQGNSVFSIYNEEK